MEADAVVLVGQLCYRQMGWIETYMNSPEVKKRELRCRTTISVVWYVDTMVQLLFLLCRARSAFFYRIQEL